MAKPKKLPTNFDAFEDGDEITQQVLKGLDVSTMPEELYLMLETDGSFSATIARKGDQIIVGITEEISTKFWNGTYSAQVYAKAMYHAVKVRIADGEPYANPKLDDEDVDIRIEWELKLPITTTADELFHKMAAAYEDVNKQTDEILP